MKIIKKEDMTTSQWSGGTTTQIMIYPENSDYGKRDFLWRLSSARVELEKSDFTPLPGVDRILMVLEGTLKVNHQGHYSKVLAPYETDLFSGGWATTSEGKVTDFNLMTRENAVGFVDKISIRSGGKSSIEIPVAGDKPERIWNFYYCPEAGIDAVCVNVNGMKRMKLDKGDLLMLTEPMEAECLVFENNNKESATVVFGSIMQGRGGQQCSK